MAEHPNSHNSSHTGNPGDSVAEEVIETYNTLRAERTNFDSHWRDVAERFLPTMKNEFEDQSPNMTKGEERNDEQFDSTGAISLGRFTSIMDSLLTPRNSRWHRLQVSNRELQKERAVRIWFDEVTDILFKFRYTPEANFSSQNFSIYEGVGAFGNGPMFIDQLAKGVGIRYKACNLGGCYFLANHQGLIDGLFRRFNRTARQMVQQWPDTVPDEIRKKAEDSKGSGTEFQIIHCVKPRENVDLSRGDFKGMPFVSYYVAIEGKVVLEEGGFRSFPYAVARHKQAPNEVYARSPAMEVLPSMKTLNEQKRTVLKQGHRVTDPVLLAYDDGVNSRFSMRPGAMNFGGVNRDGRALIQALPTGDVAIGREMMEDERNDIKDVFLVTLFQILVESPNMTATEVLERVREKGVLLAPAFGKLEAEYLGPLIEREINVLGNQGLFPPMPPVLVEAEGEFDIIYDSPFSRTQRAEEASGLMRVFEFAVSVATNTGKPEILDHFDVDAIIPDLAHIQGIKEKWMRSAQDIQVIREARAEAAAREQAIQAAPGAAGLIKSAAVAQEKAPELVAQAVAAEEPG